MSNWRRVWLLQAPLALETELKKFRCLSVNQFSRSSLNVKVQIIPFLKHFHLCQPMPVHLHGRNGAGASSLPSSGLPIPTKGYPNEPFGVDAGDESDDEEELIQDGSPQLPKEKSLIPALCVMPKSIPFHPQLRTLEVGKQFDFAYGSFGY